MRIEEAIELITSIAEMVGGSVSRSNDGADGTHVSIAFGALTPPQQKSVAGRNLAAEKPLSVLPPDGKRKRVLHVEDVDRAGDLIHYYLRNYYEVTTVNNGEEALLIVTDTQYDFILMDLDLGAGLDGFELTKLIRKLPNYRDTPIIAITGRATKMDAEKSLASGCNAYLAKPFLKNDLLRLLEEVA